MPSCPSLLLGSLLTLIAVHYSFGREWQSSAGKSLQGSFIKLNGDTLTLKGTNGQPIHFPLNVLKEEDQKYARDAQTFVDAAVKAGADSIKSFEAGQTCGDGMLCRLALARVKPTDPIMFAGAQIYLYPEPGTSLAKGTKVTDRLIFYTGERSLHPLQGEVIKLQSYATTVDRAMTAMSQPLDIYEPKVEIAEVRGLGYPISETGLVLVNAKLLINATDIMIDLGTDLQPGTVIANNSDLGIAIVSCKAAVTAMHLAPRKPLVLGQPIVTLSLNLDPRGAALIPAVSSNGTITNLNAASNPLYFEHDAPRDPKALGGIVLSEKGDVLGIMAELPQIKRGDTNRSPYTADTSNSGPLNLALRTDALMPYLTSLPKVAADRVATESDSLPGKLNKIVVSLRIGRETFTDMTPKPGVKIAEADADKMRWSIGGVGRIRHNSTCAEFNPKRPCRANAGNPCPKCGG